MNGQLILNSHMGLGATVWDSRILEDNIRVLAG